MDEYTRFTLLALIVALVSAADAAAVHTPPALPNLASAQGDDLSSQTLSPIMFEHGYHHAQWLSLRGVDGFERPSTIAPGDRVDSGERRYADYFHRHFLARRSIALRFENRHQAR